MSKTKVVELSNEAYETVSNEVYQALEAFRKCDGFACKEDKKMWKEIADEFEIDWDDEYADIPCGDDDTDYEALDSGDGAYPSIADSKGFKIDDFD